jgi:ornithine cyclodeaminase
MEIRIYTPSEGSARKLAGVLCDEHPDLNALAVDSPAKAILGAVVITCATTSSVPVFPSKNVRPGVHINGIGSFTRDMVEVDVAGLQCRRVFVDSRSAALAEAGDLIKAVSEGHLRPEELLELGNVISGDVQGRTNEEEITFFKSVGLAVQDAATVQAILNRADYLGIGNTVEL